ncbi:MAG: hypothetical protein US52_C0034G0003 [candidate division WS6 bacterium GW2011_GWA2_37_6]|uniref:Uncharacterized protein n=1 Tax=candidate division WS6 bacterium GW2011_GWA2_37_6 TaxID=1619087 RepID=A0A0G0GYQ4_9BACT|nr:MAG: hypothetical protein US52_C0034G0003 [candidate division WS6 bacterium GW2011_GWA2_37_6]
MLYSVIVAILTVQFNSFYEKPAHNIKIRATI